MLFHLQGPQDLTGSADSAATCEAQHSRLVNLAGILVAIELGQDGKT